MEGKEKSRIMGHGNFQLRGEAYDRLLDIYLSEGGRGVIDTGYCLDTAEITWNSFAEIDHL